MGTLNSTLTSEQIVGGGAVVVAAVSAALYAANAKSSPSSPDAPPGSSPSSKAGVDKKKDKWEKRDKPKKEKDVKENEKSPAPDDAPAVRAPSPAPLSKAAKKKAARAIKSDDEPSATVSVAASTASLAVPGALPDGVKKSIATAPVSSGAENSAASSSKQPKKKTKKKTTKSPAPAASATSAATAPSQDDDDDDEEEAKEIPIRPTAIPTTEQTGLPGSSLLAKRSYNKFSALSDSQLTTAPSLEASWTRVDPRKKRVKAEPTSASLEGGSDAGVTTTTGDESQGESRENVKPSPRPKSLVDDMLPAENDGSRVVRVVSGLPEKPAGVSWGDYEDAHELQHSADGDADDEGWGIVEPRKPRTPVPAEPSSASESSDPKYAKRQKEHQKAREAEKAAKADAEVERLARLAEHRKEQEKAQAEEEKKQAAKQGKSSKISGGMTAKVVDGHLVWE